MNFGTPGAGGIKILKGDSPRVDLGVAGKASRVVAMIFDAFFQCESGDLGISQVYLGNGRGGWRWRVVEQAFQ